MCKNHYFPTTFTTDNFINVHCDVLKGFGPRDG